MWVCLKIAPWSAEIRHRILLGSPGSPGMESLTASVDRIDYLFVPCEVSELHEMAQAMDCGDELDAGEKTDAQ